MEYNFIHIYIYIYLYINTYHTSYVSVMNYLAESDHCYGKEKLSERDLQQDKDQSK